MAFISIADYRTLASVDASSQTDAEAGTFLGAASALIGNVTGRQLGHYIESLEQVGGETVATVYGHMLDETGAVWIAGSSNSALSGKYEYEYVDQNRVRLIDAPYIAGVSGARMFPRAVADYDIMDFSVSVSCSPIYSVEEVRVDNCWDSYFSTEEAFADDSVVDSSEYYVPKEASPIFVSQVQFRAGAVRTQYLRVPGFVGARRKQGRRIARITYYSGTLRVPMDLALAVAVTGKLVATDPAGQFQSESYDYYSYSRMSIAELKEYPLSVISTINRYSVSA